MSEIKKKKKKRSFMRNIKKMNQRGSQGKGGHLPQEIYTYYLTLYEDLKKIGKEEKDLLIQRILRELIKENRVKDFASNQLGSRMLEEILLDAPTKCVFPVIDAFSEDLRPILIDQFSSFVLQTLLNIAFKNIQDGAMEKMENSEEEPVPIDENSKSNFISFLLKVSRFTYNNLEDFIQDKYASHVVRTVLEVCSGVKILDPAKNKGNMKLQNFLFSKEDNNMQVVEVPESLTSVWHEYLERIKHLPNFEELILGDCESATLQTALRILDGRKDSERIVSLASHIIEHGFMKLEDVNAEIHPVFINHPTCRLMEVLVTVVPEKNQELIYSAFFRDQMKKLVNHGNAWYAVDKLFASWKSKKLFTSVLNAHTDCLEEAVLRRKCQILHSAVRSCRRLQTCQNRIIKIIVKICECDESEENQHRFIGPLLYMLKWKDYEEQKETGLPYFSSFGSYILQEMLHFKKTTIVANGILQMSCNELFRMACDSKASHVIDTFFSSPLVEENLKEDLYKKLKGNYVAMACTVHGSFIVEHIFNFLNLKMKIELCEELLKTCKQLKASPRGCIIYNKLQLRHFTEKDGKVWREKFEKLSAKRLFLTRMRDETEELDSLEEQKKQTPLKKRKKNPK